MSTKTERLCDICHASMGSTIGLGERAYRVRRYGAFDDVDICSPTCLATLAIGEAWEDGEAHAEAVARRTIRKRKWWWQR